MFVKLMILPLYLILPFTQQWFNSRVFWFVPFILWLVMIIINALVERARERES